MHCINIPTLLLSCFEFLFFLFKMKALKIILKIKKWKFVYRKFIAQHTWIAIKHMRKQELSKLAEDLLYLYSFTYFFVSSHQLIWILSSLWNFFGLRTLCKQSDNDHNPSQWWLYSVLFGHLPCWRLFWPNIVFITFV